uniref:Uncharacterized protein n=1 Tax=Timema poppense TaxID=170557 RepID=A0A7R9CZM4_TIMPO|nr:unnamed protein product [Timema poppensis]
MERPSLNSFIELHMWEYGISRHPEDTLGEYYNSLDELGHALPQEMKDGSEKKQGHGKRKGGVLDDDDMEEAPGVRKRLKGKKKKHRH